MSLIHPLNLLKHLRHTGESRYLASFRGFQQGEIPVFTGMTSLHFGFTDTLLRRDDVAPPWFSYSLFRQDDVAPIQFIDSLEGRDPVMETMPDARCRFQHRVPVFSGTTRDSSNANVAELDGRRTMWKEFPE